MKLGEKKTYLKILIILISESFTDKVLKIYIWKYVTAVNISYNLITFFSGDSQMSIKPLKKCILTTHKVRST